MLLRYFIYIVVAVTTFVATYLLFQDEQPLPNVPANPLAFVQETEQQGKSDRLQGIKQELRQKLVQLVRYELPTNEHSSEVNSPEQALSHVTYYAYSEVPPDKRPADIVLASLKDIPNGTPIEEIKRASDAVGLDFNFMKAVAKVESDFDPEQRTGSYIGLFQLSNHEFAKYGSGSITNPRDNAVAAAYKFITEAIQFELSTHKKPTLSDLYLIHQ